MKIEQISDKLYRVRKQYNGKRHSVYFDHKPSQREITLKFAEVVESQGNVTQSKTTFEACAKKYIASKNNILSPSTIAGYEKILRQVDKDFKAMCIYDITQLDIQEEVNRYSEGRKPKTVANFHGFMYSVFDLFRPKMDIRTTLPQKDKFESYVPTEEDIKAVLKESKGTDYYIMFQLGVLGLRRSEACCISSEDVKGNLLTINKALVQASDNKWVVKHITKTTEGMRDIYIPTELANLIIERGDKFDKLPESLLKELHRIQDRLGLNRFRYHDLRHFYATYAHSKGMSDADIMASGGWKSDYTMKSVYRHEMQKNKEEHQKSIANDILS